MHRNQGRRGKWTGTGTAGWTSKNWNETEMLKQNKQTEKNHTLRDRGNETDRKTGQYIYTTHKNLGIFGFRVKFQDEPKMHYNLYR